MSCIYVKLSRFVVVICFEYDAMGRARCLSDPPGHAAFLWNQQFRASVDHRADCRLNAVIVFALFENDCFMQLTYRHREAKHLATCSVEHARLVAVFSCHNGAGHADSAARRDQSEAADDASFSCARHTVEPQ